MEYDPIKRLTDELSRHSGAIEGLNSLSDNWKDAIEFICTIVTNILLIILSTVYIFIVLPISLICIQLFRNRITLRT